MFQPEELLVTVALHGITILLFYNLHVLYTLSVLLGKYIYIYKYYTCITATRTISSSFQFSIYPGKKRNPYKTSIVKDLLQSMLLTTYIHSWPTIAQWSLKFGSKNQRIVAYLLHILGQACICVMCTIPIQYTWSNTNQQSLSSNSVGLLESIIETLVWLVVLYATALLHNRYSLCSW